MDTSLPDTDLDALLKRKEWLQRLASHLVRDEARADDLVAEVWHAALVSRGVQSSLGGWARGVMQKAARMSHRSERNRKRREREAAADEAVHPEASGLEFFELQRAVANELARLPDTYRDVLILRYWDDLPPRAIAKRLAIPIATVRTRHARAVEKLRERLDAELGGRRAWALALVPFAARREGTLSAGGTALVALRCAATLLVIAAGMAAVRATVGNQANGESEARAPLARSPVPAFVRSATPVAGSHATPNHGPEYIESTRTRVAVVPEDETPPLPFGVLAISVSSTANGRRVPGAAVSVLRRDDGESASVHGYETSFADHKGEISVDVLCGVPLLVRANDWSSGNGSNFAIVEPLAAGETSGVEIAIATEEDLVFWGRALGVDSHPLPGWNVQLLEGSSWSVNEKGRIPPDVHELEAETATDDAGLFSFRAASWRWPMVWIEGPSGASALVEVVAGFDAPERAREIRLSAVAELHGRVVDGLGRALDGFDVELGTDVGRWLRPDRTHFDEGSGEIVYRAESTADGFRARGLPAGVPLQVFLLRDGERVHRRGEVVELAPGERRELVLALRGSACIAGVAVDEAGAPASDLDVWLVEPSGYDSELLNRHEPFAVARTDSEGRFAFDDLAPGRWWVGPAPRSAEVVRTDPGMRDRPDSAWAMPRVHEAEIESADARVDLRIIVERGLYLRGRVVGPDGDPVPLAVVRATSGGITLAADVRDGAFELGPVDSGTWRLRADGSDGGLLASSIEVEASPGGASVVLRLTLGCRLRGVVVRAPSAPPTAARVQLSIVGTNAPDAWGYDLGGGTAVGVFERGNLASGAYSIRASTDDGYFGDLDVTLRPGQVRDDLVVVVAPAATLELRASDDGKGRCWQVQSAGELVAWGFVVGEARTAVPAGRLVLEHWPRGLNEPERTRLELDLAQGEVQRIVLD
jgi:RNA polymerase sigma factor (sigma-70 family)